jgi:cytochrome d ubiquinol oxidase subunit I
MQTPAGHSTNAAGQFVAVDWWEIIFNPSFPYRLVHMVLAAYLTTAFVVGAAAAFHLLKGRGSEPQKVMFSMALWMAAIVAPLQIVAGDMHGINTFEHQPRKIAAMEGHYETQAGAPLYLFGWPDDEAEVTRYALAIPKLGSLILTHDLNGIVRGLKDWPKDERPPAAIVFWSFRIMVGIGFLMALLGLWSLWHRWRGTLYTSRPLQWAALIMGPSGFIAVLAGWVTTEVGRQPYTVYGLLRTSESVSPVAAPAVSLSLLLFIIVYFAVYTGGVYYLFRLLRSDPVRPPPVPEVPVPMPTHQIREAGEG